LGFYLIFTSFSANLGPTIEFILLSLTCSL